MKLNAEELKLLDALGETGPEGDGVYQYNYWSPQLSGFGGLFGPVALLTRLKRRGLVGQEGRGKWAQYFITKKGVEARSEPR